MNSDLMNELLKRADAYRAELLLEIPEWYNPHDYASGQWRGRTSVLKRELAWIEKVIQDHSAKVVPAPISIEDTAYWADRN